MKVLVQANKKIVLDVQLNGNNMNNINNKNLIKTFQNFIINNLRYILISTSLLIIVLIIFQAYNYLNTQELKKTSINFFKSIQDNEVIYENLKDISETDSFYSTLSILKLIQNNNEENNFNLSNELYKKLISSNKLDKLYKSSIAVHASYTLIDASYNQNSLSYLDDIAFYINNISNDLESYFSIKKELEYLLLVTEVDINKSDYKNNSEVLEIYNDIYDSSLISSSVKERVKKIHDFQLYK